MLWGDRNACPLADGVRPMEGSRLSPPDWLLENRADDDVPNRLEGDLPSSWRCDDVPRRRSRELMIGLWESDRTISGRLLLPACSPGCWSSGCTGCRRMRRAPGRERTARATIVEA